MIFLIGFSLFIIIRAVAAGFRPKDVRADACPTEPEKLPALQPAMGKHRTPRLGNSGHDA
jgi:hypothetical protein